MTMSHVHMILANSMEQMMDEFMQQPAQMPGAPSPFAMDNMRQELNRMSQHNGSGAWANEFDPGMQHNIQPNSPGFNPAEFARFQQANAAQRTASPIMSQQSTYQSPMQMGGMGYSGMGMMGMQRSFSPMYQQPMQNEPVQAQGKGKGRMVELDDEKWEAEFANLEQTDQQLDDEANAAIEAELNQMDRSVQDPLQEAADGEEFGDFENIWKGIQAEVQNARSLVEDEEWIDSMGQKGEWENFDDMGYHMYDRDPHLGDYLFEQGNPFLETLNPFDEGVQIMDSGGNLSLAALAFEAAVQKDGTHVAAWVRLGSAQAQNEKETPAIRALEEAIKLDANNLEALMGLAVSYTNENYEATAYRTLERWLATKYPDLITEPLSEAAEMGFTNRSELHEKVTNLFIRAAQLSPTGETMDPDVQVGLGVLFYSADEFDKAVDCFEAALASTEAGVVNQENNLHLLWNRLGATLANSGRSEDAIHAYERALDLRPNFVRARYNLGVSCINIGVHEQAAGHLLGALSMHRVVEAEARQKAKEIVAGAGGAGGVSEAEVDRLITQNQSTNLYDTLRRVFNAMNRRDLSDIVGPGMDVERFRGDFEF
jgi:peroxin-5